MTIAEAAEDYVRMSIKEEEARPDPGTDLALLLEGWRRSRQFTRSSPTSR
jgi:hypothetical protein